MGKDDQESVRSEKMKATKTAFVLSRRLNRVLPTEYSVPSLELTGVSAGGMDSVGSDIKIRFPDSEGLLRD